MESNHPSENSQNLRTLPVSKTTSEKIIGNTIFNVLGQVWGLITVLVLTPYIINHIGMERYGIWAIIGVVTGYFGLLDFGLGISFVKYISEYYTKDDYKSLNQVINTGFVFYSLFGAVIIVLGLLIIEPLLKFLSISENLHIEAFFIFTLGIIVFALSNAFSVFRAILNGLQRMDIINKVGIVTSIPSIIGTIFFLEKGYGLKGLMVNNAIIFFITTSITLIIAFRLLPQLRIRPFIYVKREMFKLLFNFGYKLQFARIADIIIFQTDRLLVGSFCGMSLLAFYHLGSRIILYGRVLSVLIISALVPAFSELDAANDRMKLRELYFRSSKYLSLVSIPIILFMITSAQNILFVWMGSGYEKSAWIVQILGVGYLVNVLAGAGTTGAQGIGKPEFQMRAGIISAVSNIFLSLLLLIKYGFVGVAIGSSISLILGPIYFFTSIHKMLEIPLLKFIKKVFLTPAIVSISFCLLIWFLNRYAGRRIFSYGRIVTLIIFVFEGGLFFIIYTVILFKRQYIDAFDLNIINRCLLFVKNVLKRN